MAHRPSSRALVTVAMVGGLLVSGCGGDDDGDTAAPAGETSLVTTPPTIEIDESLPLSQRAESLTGVQWVDVDVTDDTLDVTMSQDATVQDGDLDCLAVSLILVEGESAELHYPDGDHDCD